MRKPRIKREGEDSYHHIFNHLCVKSDEWPLTDVDKERGMQLLKDLSCYYLIEIISAAWLGNHFHLVCFAPGEAPDIEEVALRHNRFWKKKNKAVAASLRKPLLDHERDPDACFRQSGGFLGAAQTRRGMVAIPKPHEKTISLSSRTAGRKDTSLPLIISFSHNKLLVSFFISPVEMELRMEVSPLAIFPRGVCFY